MNGLFIILKTETNRLSKTKGKYHPFKKKKHQAGHEIKVIITKFASGKEFLH
jgi:hypothetical protein